MKTETLHIRSATPEDAPALAPLLSEVGFPMTPTVIAAQVRFLDDAGDLVLVAERRGLVAGVATVHFTPALHRAKPVARITLLSVAPGSRGSGVGTSLMAEIERAVETRGLQILEVISNKRYADAHGFYESLGFELSSFKFKKVL